MDIPIGVPQGFALIVILERIYLLMDPILSNRAIFEAKIIMMRSASQGRG
jgi:hypothetical protein